MLTLALAATGCGIASSTTTGGPESQLRAVTLTDAQVTDLGVDGIGNGAVSWWLRPGDPAPRAPLDVVAPFAPAADFATVEVVHPEVTDAGDGSVRDPQRSPPAVPEVVLRPAWTTTVDNESGQPSNNAVVDEVTVRFLSPGSPGQHPDDDDAAVIEVDARVEVPADACVELVGLQAWQLGAAEVEAPDDAVQADYLGWVVAEMPCE